MNIYTNLSVLPRSHRLYKSVYHFYAGVGAGFDAGRPISVRRTISSLSNEVMNEVKREYAMGVARHAVWEGRK